MFGFVMFWFFICILICNVLDLLFFGFVFVFGYLDL